MPDVVSFTAPYTASGFGASAPVNYASGSIGIPSPRATRPTVVHVEIIPSDGSGIQWCGQLTVTATTIGFRLMRLGSNPSNGTALVTLDYG